VALGRLGVTLCFRTGISSFPHQSAVSFGHSGNNGELQSKAEKSRAWHWQILPINDVAEIRHECIKHPARDLSPIWSAGAIVRG
jgi:hypothetical protein